MTPPIFNSVAGARIANPRQPEEFLVQDKSQIDWRKTHIVSTPSVHYPVTENTTVSTNAIAQWSLAAMENFAWARKWLGK